MVETVVLDDGITDRLFKNGFETAVLPTTTTKFVYLGHHLVAKERKNGTTTQRSYVHTDALGSRVAETDIGAKVGRNRGKN